MAKKVLIISTSLRGGSNSDILANECAKGAKEAGSIPIFAARTSIAISATHVELYKAFPNIGGVVHTHSSWATSWAQAGRAIPCYGTTHADYIYGEVPCARCLEGKEFEEYEKNTGLLIVDLFKDKDYEAVPAVPWIRWAEKDCL